MTQSVEEYYKINFASSGRCQQKTVSEEGKKPMATILGSPFPTVMQPIGNENNDGVICCYCLLALFFLSLLPLHDDFVVILLLEKLLLPIGFPSRIAQPSCWHQVVFCQQGKNKYQRKLVLYAPDWQPALRNTEWSLGDIYKDKDDW